MPGKNILPPPRAVSPTLVSPTLDIGRAYGANDAAAILGITTYVLNERVKEGWIKPLFETGDRRYSGYALAQLLGWPLKDNLRLELTAAPSVRTGAASRPMRRVRAVCPGVSLRT